MNDLEEARTAPAESSTRVHRRPAAWLVGPALGMVALLAYFAWPGRRESAPMVSERFNLQPPAGVQVQPTGPNPVLAISPDGRWVAFRGASSEPGKAGLYLRSIGDTDATQVARSMGDSGRTLAPAGLVPFFSPDSRWLAFFAGNAVHKVPVAGGTPERICQVPNVSSVRGVHWGDNGTIVIALDRALWTVPSTGGELTQLTRPAADERHYWPHVLPDGTAALFVVNKGYNDRFRWIAVVSLKTGETRTFPALVGTAPRFVRDGYIVFSRYGALHAAPFDVSRQEVTGDAVKVLDGINTFSGAGSVAADVSASGSLVYTTGPRNLLPDGELIWIDPKGAVAPLLPESRRYIGAALDPDGKHVVATIGDDVGEGDLWLLDIGQGSWTQLTQGMHAWSELAWSPDGQWIFFSSFRSGRDVSNPVERRTHRSADLRQRRVGTPRQRFARWEHRSVLAVAGIAE
jgi:hypothetical protein